MQAAPLLELMSQQVSRECEESLAHAKQEAASIVQAAEERGTGQRAEALKTAKDELAALSQRSRERAEAEAQMIVLTTKDTITDEIMEEVQRKLRQTAESSGFPAVLEALLEELLEEAPQGGVVLVPGGHLDHCKRCVEAHGRNDLRVEALVGLKDGVAVQDPERSFRVTNTLGTRFMRREGDLRKLCLKRLFGGESENV